MRLWVKEEDRRPNPDPVRTDDRAAIVAGLALWAIAAVVLLIFMKPLLASGHGWWLWTCIGGIGIGFGGLVYTHRREQRQRR